MDEKKILNGITLELHKRPKRLEVRGMIKIQDKEIWSTIPVNSREEFDDPPADMLKTIVMGCTNFYFRNYVNAKGR